MYYDLNKMMNFSNWIWKNYKNNNRRNDIDRQELKLFDNFVFVCRFVCKSLSKAFRF